MSIQDATKKLFSDLSNLYDKQEAAVITDWIMEKITALPKIDRVTNKHLLLSAPQEQLLARYTTELLNHKPVQYVLHEAWFYGMAFYVDENVLIPRPETEELVAWVLEEAGSRKYEVENTKPEDGGPGNERSSYIVPPTSYLGILDIGTGSGCIPISLKKKLPQANLYACDVSEQALAVAAKNAATLQTPVQFLQADFLNTGTWTSLP